MSVVFSRQNYNFLSILQYFSVKNDEKLCFSPTYDTLNAKDIPDCKPNEQ